MKLRRHYRLNRDFPRFEPRLAEQGRLIAGDVAGTRFMLMSVRQLLREVFDAPPPTPTSSSLPDGSPRADSMFARPAARRDTWPHHPLAPPSGTAAAHGSRPRRSSGVVAAAIPRALQRWRGRGRELRVPRGEPSRNPANLATSPGVWLSEIAEVPKLKFLFLMLAPLLFLPLLAPAAFLVALPGLLMASLAAHLARDTPSGRRIGALLPWWMLGAALSFNVIFSPSPMSTAFWLGQPEWLRWPYHFQAYLVTDRERRLREALERHVPVDAVVASQNNINSSQLAHRAVYMQFPQPGPFVVVDTRRPLFVLDGADPKVFMDSVRRFQHERPTLYDWDGFPAPGPRP